MKHVKVSNFLTKHIRIDSHTCAYISIHSLIKSIWASQNTPGWRSPWPRTLSAPRRDIFYGCYWCDWCRSINSNWSWSELRLQYGYSRWSNLRPWNNAVEVRMKSGSHWLWKYIGSTLELHCTWVTTRNSIIVIYKHVWFDECRLYSTVYATLCGRVHQHEPFRLRCLCWRLDLLKCCLASS